MINTPTPPADSGEDNPINRDCGCEGWLNGWTQLSALQSVAFARTGWQFKGEEIHYCPWCAKPLDAVGKLSMESEVSRLKGEMANGGPHDTYYASQPPPAGVKVPHILGIGTEILECWCGETHIEALNSAITPSGKGEG